MTSFLALLPIIIVLTVSLMKGVKTAVGAGLVVTLMLFFYWGATSAHLGAALAISALSSLNILFIVFGATFLYGILYSNGFIDRMVSSLRLLSGSPTTHFFLISFGLTAFFEGVAGFGTPGAIVPLLLIAMGYEPLRSVSTVLLFDGIFSAFGAVGTPLVSGLQMPLALTESDMQTIGIYTAGQLILLAAVMLLYQGRRWPLLDGTDTHTPITVWWLSIFFAVPYCLFAWLVPELASITGALTMLALSFVHMRKPDVAINLSDWIPYIVLAFLLVLPKMFTALREFLNWEFGFEDLFGTGFQVGFSPFLSPIVPFVLVGLGVAAITRNKSMGVRSSVKKVGQVAVVLFPTILIAQLMIVSGVDKPSMVQYIASFLSRSGDGYPFLSPFIGVLGTFITGSTTLSNIVFAPSQLEAAQNLNLNELPVLSLQLAGASIGNAICLFNIIAAASVAGIDNYKAILARNMWPTLLIGMVLGLVGLFIA